MAVAALVGRSPLSMPLVTPHASRFTPHAVIAAPHRLHARSGRSLTGWSAASDNRACKCLRRMGLGAHPPRRSGIAQARRSSSMADPPCRPLNEQRTRSHAAISRAFPRLHPEPSPSRSGLPPCCPSPLPASCSPLVSLATWGTRPPRPAPEKQRGPEPHGPSPPHFTLAGDQTSASAACSTASRRSAAPPNSSAAFRLC